MEGISLIFLFLAALFGFLAIGVPIAHTLILVAVSLLFAIDNFEPQFVAQSVIYGANSFTLLAIPFFILAGEIMSYGGISKRIVHSWPALSATCAVAWGMSLSLPALFSRGCPVRPLPMRPRLVPSSFR